MVVFALIADAPALARACRAALLDVWQFGFLSTAGPLVLLGPGRGLPWRRAIEQAAASSPPAQFAGLARGGRGSTLRDSAPSSNIASVVRNCAAATRVSFQARSAPHPRRPGRGA